MFDSWKIDSQGAAGFSRNRYLHAGLGLLALLVLGAAAVIAPSTAGAEVGTTLSVDKTAAAQNNRTYDWAIDKYTDPANDESGLSLTQGQDYSVTYKVKVTPSNQTDTVVVSGDICVENGGAVATQGLSIVDRVIGTGNPNDPNLPVYATQNVDLGAFDELPASDGVPGSGPDYHCYPYSFQGLPSVDPFKPGTEYRNEALVTIQNHSGSGGPQEHTTASRENYTVPALADVECVDVNDTYEGAGTDGFLGTVCGDGGEVTFTYTRPAPTEECDEFMLENTASFENDRVSGSDSVSIPVTVTGCNGDGCTLTQGYWKTHSSYGPAKKTDSGWAAVGGPDATFFLSGKSYHQVLLTSPGGNAYYVLAHQYIAALLNSLNGAGVPANVQTALATSTTLFNTANNTPTYIGSLSGNNSLRKQFLSLASTLDQYNNGIIGPGHCSENSNSA